MKILNMEKFEEEDLPEVFKIGYLSNDSICVLSKLLKAKELNKEDIESLNESLNLLEDFEKGSEAVDSFQYVGANAPSVSIFWQLTKLIYIFSEQSFDEIIRIIIENRDALKDLLKDLDPTTKISQDKFEKVLKIKDFLSMLSRYYQNVFFNR